MTNARQKKKILIIDDDETIAIILKEFLVNKNYSATFVTQVTDVDLLIAKEKPNLIFLDYRMSPMTGKDILEKVSLRNRDLPVVMMSAYRTREGEFEVKNLGAVEYISKPFDFVQLENLLVRLLG